MGDDTNDDRKDKGDDTNDDRFDEAQEERLDRSYHAGEIESDDGVEKRSLGRDATQQLTNQLAQPKKSKPRHSGPDQPKTQT